jgi:hypothetical protein
MESIRFYPWATSSGRAESDRDAQGVAVAELDRNRPRLPARSDGGEWPVSWPETASDSGIRISTRRARAAAREGAIWAVFIVGSRLQSG